MKPVFTDSKGEGIPRPERADYKSDYEYAIAYHEYKRRVDSEASKAVYHK